MELRSSLSKKAVWGGLVLASIATIGFANAQGWGKPGLGRDGDRITPGLPGDDIQPAPNPIVPDLSGSTDFSWNQTTTGQTWSLNTNWTPSSPVGGPDAAGLFVTVNTNITATHTISLFNTGDAGDLTKTIGRLDIGDTNANNNFTIAAGTGSGVLDFNGDGANAQLNNLSTAGSNTTISAPITLSTSLDITNASAAGNLTLSGGITSGTAGTKTITTSTGTVTASTAAIGDGSGVIAIVQNGPGTLALGTVANTYSGGTTIAGGNITIGGSGTPLGSGTLTLSGGSLVATANRASGATLTNNIAITADSALTTTSSAATNALRFGGTLTGTGGTLTVRNDASSTSNLFDLILSGADYTMSRPIVIDNGASSGTTRISDFNTTSTTHQYDGVISGNGGFNRSASVAGTGGTTIFTAANSYTGATTISQGSLVLGNGGTTGSLSTSSAITVNAGGSFSINRSNAVVQGTDFSGSAITGAGKFAQIGTGTTTLNIANSLSGTIAVGGGTLIASADGALGTGSVSLTASSVTLTLQSGAVNNYIADTASISIVTGAIANLNFTGANDVVGGITLNGVVQSSSGTYGAIGSGADNESAFFTGTGLLQLTLVPEPATYMLLGVGLLICAQRIRRKRV